MLIESDLGEGSTFGFKINLKVGEAPESQKEEESLDFDFSNLKVLLVEDHVINQKLALKVLSKIGIEADLAENGLIATEKVADNEYDVIFMDFQMPVMDGISATEQIRKTNKDVYIIAMTASVFAEDKQKCFDVGMNSYIPKPIKKSVIIENLIEAQAHLLNLKKSA